MALRDALTPGAPFRLGASKRAGRGDDEAAAWSSIRDGVLHVRGSYMLWGQGAHDVSGAREAVAAFEDQIRASCIVGTPEQVVARLRPSIEKIDSMGFAETFVSVILAPPGTPAERAREAVERFAGEVIPAL